ncbi:site-specific integrase, partial [Rubripirellula sp.]|nr:site-specific integrase [Rubripirellula sp.]
MSRRNQLTEMLTLQYADLLSSEFGPLKLAGIRDKLIQRGNCRRYVKNLIQVIIQIFRHGVAREIVPPETLTALEALPALRRAEAHDNPPRRIPT